MATLKITIKMDNAAFENEPATEVARILHELAAHIAEDGPSDQYLKDINGNRVGSVVMVS